MNVEDILKATDIPELMDKVADTPQDDPQDTKTYDEMIRELQRDNGIL